jgi:hypothetical protein
LSNRKWASKTSYLEREREGQRDRSAGRHVLGKDRFDRDRDRGKETKRDIETKRQRDRADNKNPEQCQDAPVVFFIKMHYLLIFYLVLIRLWLSLLLVMYCHVSFSTLSTGEKICSSLSVRPVDGCPNKSFLPGLIKLHAL